MRTLLFTVPLARCRLIPVAGVDISVGVLRVEDFHGLIKVAFHLSHQRGGILVGGGLGDGFADLTHKRAQLAHLRVL